MQPQDGTPQPMEPMTGTTQPMQPMMMGTPQPMVVGGLQSPWSAAVMGVHTGRPTKQMSFITAVTTCFQKYATFDGRATRSEYWWFVLFTIITSTLLDIVEISVTGNSPEQLIMSGLFSLATFLPGLAAAVRRMHDVGKSGWFLLIPFYNLVLLLTDGESVVNQYGAIPTNE